MSKITDSEAYTQKCMGIPFHEICETHEEHFSICGQKENELLDKLEAMHDELHEAYGDMWDCFHPIAQGQIKRDEFIKTACKICTEDTNND